jgi:hypothetical protein
VIEKMARDRLDLIVDCRGAFQQRLDRLHQMLLAQGRLDDFGR